jgi:hypothetical protein
MLVHTALHWKISLNGLLYQSVHAMTEPMHHRAATTVTQPVTSPCVYTHMSLLLPGVQDPSNQCLLHVPQEMKTHMLLTIQ